MLPRVWSVRSVLYSRVFYPDRYILGACPGTTREIKVPRQLRGYSKEKGPVMSTTEALRTQLDNVRNELHESQVEIQKLRVQSSVEAFEQLKGEATDLRQQLHVAQENEASANQNLRESREEVNVLKQNIDEMQQHANELQQTLREIRVENERLVNELERIRARNDDIELEMSREREALKRAKHRAGT